ncbi:DUF1376 domain-containing protein [Novosphingobium sp.]|uniref:DUF1376 domain-containing protein n=1 Tax=Novosphingobium sp. TaxID=1874826 RepID=UPI002621A5D1|nr:DUF1376 domain-containing protein [Novosphingobium sp.]
MTMTDLPEPLTPADCDLRDFEFMPLHVARLRDSDLAAEEDPEACWYAVLLWAASWHQVPAASLPDNDAVLCKLIGLGRDLKTFRKHRAGSLRGFVKCSDGRLYHAVVAERAMTSWMRKLDQRWKTECARVRKHNQRHSTELIQPAFSDFVASDFPLSVPFLSLGQSEVVPRDSDGLSHGTSQEKVCDIGSKGEGEGEGEYTVPTGTGDAGENRSQDTHPPEPPRSEPNHPPDPNRALWLNGVALLGETARPQIARWIKTHGSEIVAEAFDRALVAKPERPAGYIQSILTRLAQEASQRAEEQRQADALFDARYPPRQMSEFEARALMPPEDFQRWQARQIGAQA